jgi:xyloglucan-specific endo-beta-1,4-glucanase
VPYSRIFPVAIYCSYIHTHTHTVVKMKAILALLFAAPLVMAQGQQLCGQYDYHGSQGYYFNNNEWGAGSGSGNQCTYVDNIDSGGVSWHTDWTWSGGENNVKSYPYSGRELGNKRIVSQIPSMFSAAQWAYEGNNIRANVAYDIFTAADPNHVTSSGDYELMIWLGRIGGVYPIGSSTGFVNIGGTNWELFVGYNGAMKVFSYVAPNWVTNFAQDVKPFFNHMAQAHGYPAGNQFLITFQFGTEPFTGQNARFWTRHWSAYIS